MPPSDRQARSAARVDQLQAALLDAERRALAFQEALAEILQYTVEPRWTQEERLNAIRNVVARGYLDD